jgi:DNA-binding NarL/FixJ family response regulator
VIGVMIVEDNWVWASAVENQINRERGMNHVATTASVDEALGLAEHSRAMVVLVDLLLGDDSGLRFARTAQARRLPAKVVLMSIDPNEWAVEQARAAGVAGFIHKEDLETGAEVVSVVRRVANGQRVFTDRVASPSASRSGFALDLTSQEIELIRCLRSGMSTDDMARHLSLGTQTVRNKVGQIGKKLGVSGRVEILASARGIDRQAHAY